MICSICKRRDVRPPTCCDKCGALACEDCVVSELPPGVWEIKANLVEKKLSYKGELTDRILLCKNCVAERTLTEDV